MIHVLFNQLTMYCIFSNLVGYRNIIFIPHCLTEKEWIFSVTVHLTRKMFVFPGRYLKADHFEKKIDMGGGLFKTAKA